MQTPAHRIREVATKLIDGTSGRTRRRQRAEAELESGAGGRLVGILLLGPKGLDLGRYLAKSAPFLCTSSGQTFHFMVVGDTRAMKPEAIEVLGRAGVDVEQLIVEWKEEVDARGDASVVEAHGTQYVAGTFGLKRADLPCLILCGSKDHRISPIPDTLCFQHQGMEKLVTILENLFSHVVVDTAVRLAPHEAECLDLLEGRFAREIAQAVREGENLHDLHEEVLLHLLGSDGRPQRTSDIAAALDRKDKSLGPYLSGLIKLELVKNLGGRQGYVLTSKGKKYAKVLEISRRVQAEG